MDFDPEETLTSAKYMSEMLEAVYSLVAACDAGLREQAIEIVMEIFAKGTYHTMAVIFLLTGAFTGMLNTAADCMEIPSEKILSDLALANAAFLANIEDILKIAQEQAQPPDTAID